MKIRVSLGETLAQAVLTDLVSGAGSDPAMEIYTGTMPASLGETITDTLLATFTLSSTVGTESGGVITFSGWTDEDSAPAGGDAGWARLLNKSGTEIMYLSAGGSGSGASVIVSPLTIVSGEPVNLTSGVIRMPV
ncbi:hypothetical protein [Marinobacter salarius]|jgi:hypothetical protein|uniref:hypothetical protein n=1 Tax=Marinobacter salarius TaxID=1420917 RepID=UPI0010A9B1EC|nr:MULTISPECIES: hypothetical protein [Marinobacter]MBJ7302565.1 hypothetical protein [Marinobacter salarius]HIO30718.1 hypothetical protein [Marinobacter salarius]HIP01783.1 hypothetical protein [Marinobacter salarius]